MKWNKKTASLFVAVSLLLGGGVMGLQANAQQSPSVNNNAGQTQVQSVGGKSDTPESTVKSEKKGEQGTEVDLPGGHQDQNGVNVDHQFQGTE